MVDYGFLLTFFAVYAGLGLLNSAILTIRGYRSANANWLPLALMAASAITSAVKGHKDAKAAKKNAQAEANAQNQYIKAQDTARQSILEGLKGRGYDVFGPQTSSSSGSSSSRSTTRGRESFDRTSEYKVAGENAAMEGKLRGLLQGRLGRGALPAGYAAGKLRAINRTFKNATGGVPAQGLAWQRGAGATAPENVARAGQIADFLGNLPLQEREMMRQAEGDVSGFLRDRAGRHDFGTSDSFSTTDQSGSSSSTHTGGPDIQSAMALMMPSGPQAVVPQAGASPLWGAASSALGAAAQYAANRPAKPAAPQYTAGGAYTNPALVNALNQRRTFGSGTANFG